MVQGLYLGQEFIMLCWAVYKNFASDFKFDLYVSTFFNQMWKHLGDHQMMHHPRALILMNKLPNLASWRELISLLIPASPWNVKHWNMWTIRNIPWLSKLKYFMVFKFHWWCNLEYFVIYQVKKQLGIYSCGVKFVMPQSFSESAISLHLTRLLTSWNPTADLLH